MEENEVAIADVLLAALNLLLELGEIVSRAFGEIEEEDAILPLEIPKNVGICGREGHDHKQGGEKDFHALRNLQVGGGRIKQSMSIDSVDAKTCFYRFVVAALNRYTDAE